MEESDEVVEIGFIVISPVVAVDVDELRARNVMEAGHVLEDVEEADTVLVAAGVEAPGVEGAGRGVGEGIAAA